MKHDKLIQRFLNEYYFVTAMLPNTVDTKEVFDKLCEVYFISHAANTAELWATISADKLSNIKTVDQYNRVARKIEYDDITGVAGNYNEDQRVLLFEKGAGLKSALALIPALECKCPSDSAIYRGLYDLFLAGNIEAIRVLGFLTVNGYSIEKNTNFGFSLLAKAAMWLDADAALMLYNADKKYSALVNAVLQVAPTESGLQLPKDLVLKAITAGDKNVGTVAVVKMVYDYFKYAAVGSQSGISKKYDPMVVKIAYSPILTLGDKRRVLLSTNRALMAAVSELPLGEDGTKLKVNLSQKFTVLNRPDEQENIKLNLSAVARRADAEYKPLLFTSDDAVVLDIYKENMLKMLGGNEVCTVDASNLCFNDFESTVDNVFISALINSNELDTIFFIEGCNACDERVAAELAKWLKTSYRAKYRLLSPKVTLDLSQCFFVLFCKKKPLSLISEECEIVTLRAVEDKEKPAVISYLAQKYQNQFKLKEVKIENEAETLLATFSAEKIARILYSILRTALAEDKNKVAIVPTDIAAAAKDTAHAQPIGFSL